MPSIYTDGSRLDTGETGDAFVVPRLGPPITKKFMLCRTGTVFITELYAIYRALMWLDGTSLK